MNEKVQIATKNSWEYVWNWHGFKKIWKPVSHSIVNMSNLKKLLSFSENPRKKEKPEPKYVHLETPT